jgi:predicted dehydrogenase
MVKRRLVPFRNPVQAIVVGCGAISHDHLDAFEATGRIRVLAVCDQDAGMLSRALWSWPEARGYLDYQELLRDCVPDLVTICTWPRLHAPMVLAAARAGVKAVLCEKPLALSMGEIDEMVRVSTELGTKIAVGHQHRFNPAFSRIKQLMHDGKLGGLRELAVLARGAVINNGIHALDLVRFLLNDAVPNWVEASCRREGDTQNRGVPTEDALTGTIGFSDGVCCSVRGGPADLPALEVRLTTTRGTVTLAPGGVTGDVPDLLAMLGNLGQSNSYHFQAAQIVDWIRGRIPTYPANVNQAALSTEVTLALYEAARTGRRVTLPLNNRGFILDQYWG